MKFLKFLIFLALYVFLTEENLLSFQDKRKILIIHSYHSGYEWTDGIQKGLLDVLSKNNIELFFEFMDLNRQKKTEEYLSKLEEFYKLKYGNQKIDLLILVDDDALEFVLKRRDRLFNNIPIVFCGINDFKPDIIRGHKNITGVNEEKSIKETIKLALKISGNPKKVYVIAGDRLSERRNLEQFKSEAKTLLKGVEVSYLNTLEFEEILKQVSSLDKKDLIFYLSYLRSPLGKSYTNEENLKKLNEATQAMIFTVSDHMVKNGVIGGKVTYSYAQGETAGRLALKILSGTRPDDIPVEMKSPNRYLFDGQALLKHNIPLAILPQDSIIINKSVESIFSDYKRDIEKGFFGYDLFKNHGTVMLIIDPKTGTIIDANDRAKFFYGYQQLIGMKIQEINTLTEDQVKEEMRKAKELKRNYFNFRHRLANGEIRDVEVYSYPIRLKDMPLLFSIIFDVTDKLLAEKKNKEEEKKILYTFIALSVISIAFLIMLLIYLLKRRLYEKELLDKNKKLEEAQSEIKTLKGIIPICMYCKKIRDDAGYWNQLEKYITEHTDALFSHALCPDCADKFLKDFMDKK
ncbi:MAG: PAS domain S-box protein [Proteobacteria bacterium]|nr:PAS domain S-box protein [Pseudomonadota bacterium]